MERALQVLAKLESDILAHADRWVSKTQAQRTEIHQSVRAAFKKLRHLVRKIGNNASRSEIKGIAGRLARCPNLRLTAVLLAHLKRPWRPGTERNAALSVGCGEELPYGELLEKREAVGLYAPGWNRPLSLLEADKDGTSTRPITAWPVEWRIRQYATLLLILAVSKDRGYNFSTKGQKACFARVKNLCSQGYRYFVSFDVKKCFESVGPQHICPVLPLPKELLRRNCFAELPDERSRKSRKGESHSPPYTDSVPRPDQHRLPQGAATSPILAIAFLQRLLTDMFGEGGPVILYLDDFTIGGRTLEEATQAAKALIQRLRQHPAGGFSVHKFHIGTLINPMKDFELGTPALSPSGDLDELPVHDYILAAGLRIQLSQCGTELRVGPSPKSVDRCRSRVADRFRLEYAYSDWNEDNQAALEAAQQRISQYFCNWVRSFPVWRPNDQELEDLELNIDIAIERVICDYRLRHKLEKSEKLTVRLRRRRRRSSVAEKTDHLSGYRTRDFGDASGDGGDSDLLPWDI